MNLSQYPADPSNYEKGRKMTLDHIIVHVALGSLYGTAAWFANPASNVSTHCTVGNAGEILQHVSFYDTAWHGGSVQPFNARSIGIEFEGRHANYPSIVWIPTDVQLAAAIELATYLCHTYTIPAENIIRHSDVMNKPQCPGHGFPFRLFRREVAKELEIVSEQNKRAVYDTLVMHNAPDRPLKTEVYRRPFVLSVNGEPLTVKGERVDIRFLGNAVVEND